MFCPVKHAFHRGHVRCVPGFKSVEVLTFRIAEKLTHVSYQRGVDVAKADAQVVHQLPEFLPTAGLVCFACHDFPYCVNAS